MYLVNQETLVCWIIEVHSFINHREVVDLTFQFTVKDTGIDSN